MSEYPIHAHIVQSEGAVQLIIPGPQTPNERDAWRKVYHDYLAAMRSLRYLAQKGLLSPLDTPEQTA